MLESSQHDLLAQVASMYYEQDMTQNEIGAQLGLSRVKVYRLLKQARVEQVVQIIINWPIERDPELEKQLVRSFGLKDALVLKTLSPNRSSALQPLGKLAAHYLERVLTNGSTMAVCLGRSTYETINAISPEFQAKVRVAQAMGSMPFSMQDVDSATLARHLAQKLDGEVLYLSSPLMADSVEAAEVLRRQREINRVLMAARSADVALLGIGNLDPVNSGFVKAGFITPDELVELVATGAAGDVAGQIYTLDGKLHPCEYNQRVIGITLAELRQIPISLAVAAGQAKAKAILGGLHAGAINVLCTDDTAAREVLRLNKESGTEI
ncbi:MAG: sugar-binding transcriptional regulator [Chloroflexi bacterium]|nr:sugar-binding transcriptional regulator [Chloroflexota bacterium]